MSQRSFSKRLTSLEPSAVGRGGIILLRRASLGKKAKLQSPINLPSRSSYANEWFSFDQNGQSHFIPANTNGCDIASAQSFRRGRRPWHVQKLLVREPGALLSARCSLRRLVRGGDTLVPQARSRTARLACSLPYVSRHGHAFIDRALYLPKEWTDDPTRVSKTGDTECGARFIRRRPRC
jgi:hypothetical protein